MTGAISPHSQPHNHPEIQPDSAVGLDLIESTVGLVTIVRFDGELDSHTAAHAHDSLTELLDGRPAVALDMGGTTYLSSAGLRVLLLAHRRALATDTRLTLAGLLPEVREVMGATGFLDFFEVTDTVDEAVTALTVAVPAPPRPARRAAS